MNEMDLVPNEFRQGLILRRNLIRCVWALVLLLGLVASARATLGYLIWREKAQVVSLEQRQQAFSRAETETESLRQQRMVTQQQLATLDLLQGNDLVERFLQSMDDAYQEHIWLDSIRFQRRDNTGAPSNATAGEAAGAAEGQPGAGAVNVLHDAQIVGHAASHTDLATFMERLGAQPTVADLRLIDTSARSYTSVQVIDFRLTLQLRGTEQP
jgi:Fimbrial assembly protein (PilN)